MRTSILPFLSLFLAAPVHADEVLLRFDGFDTASAAEALTEALRKVDSAKIATKPTKEKWEARIAIDLAKADVGDFAKVVGGLPIGGKKGTPSVSLVLAYARLDGSAAADEDYLPGKIATGLAKLKGVDGKKSSIDFKKRQLIIRLDPAGGAKLAEITKGFGGVMLTTP